MIGKFGVQHSIWSRLCWIIQFIWYVMKMYTSILCNFSTWYINLRRFLVGHFRKALLYIGFNHWGGMTHICVSNLIINGSDNGLPPERRQIIIWTNPGILLIKPLGTKLTEILIEIYIFPFKEIHLKTLSAKWWPFCLGFNDIVCVLLRISIYTSNDGVTNTFETWVSSVDKY